MYLVNLEEKHFLPYLFCAVISMCEAYIHKTVIVEKDTFGFVCFIGSNWLGQKS